MKILIISGERRYERIVNELRKSNDVDYVFWSTKFKIDKGDFHIPRLFGFRRGSILPAYLMSSFLLLTRRYDICLTDYKCLYYTTIFPIAKRLNNIIKTNFIYDIRTIPVDHDDSVARQVEQKFFRKLRFADRYYQGITVITDEMKNYLHRKYMNFKKPIGTWESGVDVNKFRPLDKNIGLKMDLGFKKDDFVCFYHGTITSKRGIIELVESFRTVKSHNGNIKMFILGGRSFDQSLDKIREIIGNHNLEDTVKLHGWVDYARIPEFISIADLCIVPLPDIDWWRVSSPLKLMEYIACGKTVLLTDIVAHTNVVGRNDNYFWIRQSTPESIAESIEESYLTYENNPHLFYNRGMTERERLVKEVSWERRSRSLQEYLSRITKTE